MQLRVIFSAASLGLLACAALLPVACSSSDGEGAPPAAQASSSTGSQSTGMDPPSPLEGRSYKVKTPTSYDGAAPAPLVVMIHQMWASETAPEDMDAYLGITPEAEARGIIVAMPLGTYDEGLGAYMWNATDACCGYFSKPDDSSFLKAMIAEIKDQYNIDEKRDFVIGQSAGGFMAHRLACDDATEIAAIATLSGAVFKDPSRCIALEPVAVLHTHGDMDGQVPFEGGAPFDVATIPPAPSAAETVAIWAGKGGCDADPSTTSEPLDLVDDLAGAETDRTVYAGCTANGAAELWTVHGGEHTPPFNASWSKLVFDFLMAHPKP
jgi:polyhydroxybutyrate depolymerase